MRMGVTWHGRIGLAAGVLAALLAASALLLAAPGGQAQQPAAPYVEGEVLVKFRAGVAVEQAQSSLALPALYVLAQIEELGLQRLAVPAGKEEDVVTQLRAAGLVEYAAPNHIAYAAIEPNDAHWPLQWNMRIIEAPAGWDIITGTAAVTIAILDTGIDLDHPDLVGKLVTGTTTVSASIGLPPDDDNGHGSHVAGIAAATTNNWMGVAGVDWGARLMPVKVLNDRAEGSYWDIINGIYFAVNNGARIINLSLTGWEAFQGLHDAVRYAAVNRGRLVVAAAGNCAGGGTGCPGVNPLAYPAAYDEVIAVGASTRDDLRAYYSEYQPYVDVLAPGGTPNNPIWSTAPNATYTSRHGTSMATAHVSGLAGLIWALNPDLTRQQVWEVLRDTAAKIDIYPYVNGRNDFCGYGRIDAGAALARVAPRLEVTPTTITFVAGNNRPVPTEEITIRNASAYAGLTWDAELSAGATRFQLAPPVAGTLAPAASTQLQVRPRTAGLAQGAYFGTVSIGSDTRGVQGSPKTVQMKLSFKPQLDLAILPRLAFMAGGPGGYEWLDAKREGIALTLSDDDAAQVNLPFRFPFYGQSYDRAWVSSNGFVTFESVGSMMYQNHCIPNASPPNNAISALWDDLDPSSRGGVYVKAFGADTYVVMWEGVPHHAIGGGSAITETFEIVLKSDGLIKLQYKTVGDASSATVGIERAGGSQAQQVACNGAGELPRDRQVIPLSAP